MPGANYVGKAGHMAVMSEFLLRGYNVAIPEVDVGDDIFVVEDLKGSLWRIQVKTALGQARKNSHSARFHVPLRQLEKATTPDLIFVFAIRMEAGRWEFVILPREDLGGEYKDYQVGCRSKEDVQFYFTIRPDEIVCSGRSLQKYRNHWVDWPPLP